MVKPVDRFARLFDAIEDLPGVVHEELELRTPKFAACLGRRKVRSQRDRVELHFDCVSFPGDLTSMQTLAVVYAELLVVVLLMLISPPVGFLCLVVGPWAVVGIANKVLLWRASCPDGSLCVTLTSDAVVLELGSEVARLECAPCSGVLVREFRRPGVTQYAVQLASDGHTIVPVTGWMNRDTAMELGQALSRTLGLPLAAQYIEVGKTLFMVAVSGRTVPANILTFPFAVSYGRSFSPYRSCEQPHLPVRGETPFSRIRTRSVHPLGGAKEESTLVEPI